MVFYVASAASGRIVEPGTKPNNASGLALDSLKDIKRRFKEVKIANSQEGKLIDLEELREVRIACDAIVQHSEARGSCLGKIWELFRRTLLSCCFGSNSTLEKIKEEKSAIEELCTQEKRKNIERNAREDELKRQETEANQQREIIKAEVNNLFQEKLNANNNEKVQQNLKKFIQKNGCEGDCWATYAKLYSAAHSIVFPDEPSCAQFEMFLRDIRREYRDKLKTANEENSPQKRKLVQMDDFVCYRLGDLCRAKNWVELKYEDLIDLLRGMRLPLTYSKITIDQSYFEASKNWPKNTSTVAPTTDAILAKAIELALPEIVITSENGISESLLKADIKQKLLSCITNMMHCTKIKELHPHIQKLSVSEELPLIIDLVAYLQLGEELQFVLECHLIDAVVASILSTKSWEYPLPKALSPETQVIIDRLLTLPQDDQWLNRKFNRLLVMGAGA